MNPSGAAGFPSFIDFEASGLDPESYPVEVAWSGPDGTVTSYLIRPEPSWTYWDPNAADIHGLSRERLDAEGLPAEIVAYRLNAALAAVGVAYSDASAFDGFWCETLLEAAGLMPEFRIAPVLEAFPGTRLAELEGYREAAYRRIGGRCHRAGTDVRALVEAYRVAFDLTDAE